MIVEQFDRLTMARIEIALDRACEHFAHGGKHNVRKRVVQSIIQCAKTGNDSLDALTGVGEHALAHLSQHGGEEPNAVARAFGQIGRARHSERKQRSVVVDAVAAEADGEKEGAVPSDLDGKPKLK